MLAIVTTNLHAPAGAHPLHRLGHRRRGGDDRRAALLHPRPAETAAGFVHLGGSDLGVFQANVSDPTASVLPAVDGRPLRRQPHVVAGDAARC